MVKPADLRFDDQIDAVRRCRVARASGAVVFNAGAQHRQPFLEIEPVMFDGLAAGLPSGLRRRPEADGGARQGNDSADHAVPKFDGASGSSEVGDQDSLVRDVLTSRPVAASRIRVALCSGGAAFTSTHRARSAAVNSAARWIAPYGRTGTEYFYANREGAARITDTREHQASTREGMVQHPTPASILVDTIEPLSGVICTSPVQTCLDLSVSGERGVESADHLRREVLSWRP